MNPAPWTHLIILLMVLAGCAGIQGALAEVVQTEPVNPSPSLSVMDAVPKPTISPTIKSTIAPIHTKEPVIKPPVDQPSVSPSLTTVPVLSPVKTPLATVSPTTTPDISASNGPGDNESASTYFQWGRAYEDAGDYLAAIQEFDRAIARQPYYSDAWYHKALSYDHLDQGDEAYQAYRFLLTIDPGYPAQVNLTRNDSNSSLKNLTPPPSFPSNEGTPLVWIASGAGIAFVVAAGIVLYHRRRTSGIPDIDDSGLVPRQIQMTTGLFPDISAIEKHVRPYYHGDRDAFCALMKLAVEIAREGREGKPVGTAFVFGDTEAVLSRSRQLILNPLAGHSENERLVTNPDMRENIKELSLVDGAFVIRENGMVEAAGRYISIDTSGVRLPKGFGTRHVSVAAITQETSAIGIVVSESGGMVRVFARGKVIHETM